MSCTRLAQALQQQPGWQQAAIEPVWLPQEQLRLGLLKTKPDQLFNAAEIGDIWANMPYWAFAWAGGRAMAQWLLEHPEAVRGKRVLDFGCGSGIAGVQAARLGAAEVWAADIDELALQATSVNAALNQVDVKICRSPLQQHLPEVDLFLAGDVLYDPNCRPLLQWLLGAIPEALLAEPDAALQCFHPFESSAVSLHKAATTISSTLPEIGDFDEQVVVDILTLSRSAAGYSPR